MTRDGSLYNTSSSASSGNHSISGRHSSYHNSLSGRANPNYDTMSSSLHQSRYGTVPVPGSNSYNSSIMASASSNIHGYNNMEAHQGLNMSVVNSGPSSRRLRETIHSGHFMVSDFEPESEALDDEYEVGMPVPPEEESINVGGQGQSQMGPFRARSMGQTVSVIQATSSSKYSTQQMSSNEGLRPSANFQGQATNPGHPASFNGPISIDGSLTKLFQCMSLAYRQKLTSPKWNPFKGVRLRWKDKIRLNNVIWRCWHMQCTPASKVILRQKALVCQFASPLDVDQHNKPEAVVMEGKYWKRKLSTVAAEYKKWRLFYRNRMMGNHHYLPVPDLHPVSLDGFDWNRVGTFGGGPISNFIFDDDLLMDFSDTLFSSLSAQAFAFPNPRELSRAGMVAEFIQPGLIQLQPNLEDFMDTLEPLQDYVNSKLLPPVPEDLDTMDPPDNLLTVDLPNMIQHRMQQTLLNKMNENSSQAGSYSSSVGNQHQQAPQLPPQQQPVYYSMSQMSESNRNSSAVSTLPPPNVPQQQLQSSPTSSRAPRALLKDNHTQGHGRSSSGGYSNSNSRNDVFAVPKGKPRGRSRSGASNSRQLVQPPTQHQTGVCPAPPAQSSMSHQRAVESQMGHSQMSSSMSSSHTLLSHLLTNSAHGHGAHYSGPNMIEKMGGGGMGPQQHMMTTQSSGPTIVDMQQHQQQPWNVKNANETLNPNVPLNFGSKSLMQNQSQSMSSGIVSGGNISPPLLSNTPSPPMGPPGSGPPSPPKQFRHKSDNDRVDNEHRRVCHINAEQKRRCNIKNGFDMLHSLIPQLSHNPNAKVSKAAMLQKGAEYIRQLKSERSALKQEIEAHRLEVEALNSAINNCQSMLPATGAPVSRQRTNKMKEMFDQWVRVRTADNWKFWIFSTLIRPLLDSYNNAVSTTSVDELCRTVLAWIDQHCSLVDLRPAVLNSLRYLCTSTDILSNPANLPEEAYKAVNRPANHSDRGGSGDSR